jgi:hypothetical protein
MAETDTPDALLTAAIQDLRAAADLLGERLGPIGRQVTDPGLCHALGELIVQARHASAALVATARGAGGPENVWMKGALDDATRDAERVLAGPLLDQALAGAVRKGLAASVTAYETAIALARAQRQDDLAGELDQLRARDVAAHGELGGLIERLAGV